MGYELLHMNLEFIDQMYRGLLEGDVFTSLMVICAFIVVFFVFKIMLNALKALIIVGTLVLLVSFFMPDEKILEKTSEAGQQAAEIVQELPSKISD